jgi:hypothetical protein
MMSDARPARPRAHQHQAAKDRAVQSVDGCVLRGAALLHVAAAGGVQLEVCRHGERAGQGRSENEEGETAGCLGKASRQRGKSWEDGPPGQRPQRPMPVVTTPAVTRSKDTKSGIEAHHLSSNPANKHTWNIAD